MPSTASRISAAGRHRPRQVCWAQVFHERHELRMFNNADGQAKRKDHVGKILANFLILGGGDVVHPRPDALRRWQRRSYRPPWDARRRCRACDASRRSRRRRAGRFCRFTDPLAACSNICMLRFFGSPQQLVRRLPYAVLTAQCPLFSEPRDNDCSGTLWRLLFRTARRRRALS